MRVTWAQASGSLNAQIQPTSFSVGPMPHRDLMHAIELFGTKVAPAVRQALQAPAETTLASFETLPATLDLNRAGRAPGASLGAGMDRGLIYPLPNREAKGDMLVPRPPLRLSIGSVDDPALLAPPSDPTALARFERAWAEFEAME